MFRSYITTSFRNLFRTKLYSFINILGLTLGITCCALLALYIVDEVQFDNMHKNADNLVRVIISDDSFQEGTRHFGAVQAPLGPDMVDEFPEVKESIRLWQPSGQITFVHEGTRFSERNWFMAESNFFNHFDFEFVDGDRNTALNEPNSVVLSESMVRKYFGEGDPMGKSLKEGRMGDLVVTGVFKDLPQNSHLQFDILVSEYGNEGRWQEFLVTYRSFSTATYLLLEESIDLEQLQNKMPAFLESKLGESAEGLSISFQPIKDIHFNSGNIEYGVEEVKGEIKYILIFLAIAIFIIAIASINYMNLATAKSMERAREIGIRKASGARRSQLIFQFLTESTIISLFSFILAVGLVDLLLPYFNVISGKDFNFNMDTLPNILLLLLAISFLVGIVSGLYPALYLSRFKPISILRGETEKGKSGIAIRKALVVTQFALSIFMIVATMVVYKQLNFIKDYDLGYNKDLMVIVDINNGNVRREFEAVRTEFGRVPNVKKVGTSSRVPGEWKNITEIVARSTDRADSLQAYYMAFDEYMLDVYNFEIISGRNFEGLRSADSTNIILNEQAAEMLGLGADPIGRRIRINSVDDTEFTVIGVLKDFNYQSLHQTINPLIIGYWNAPIRVIDYFSILISGEDIDATIKGLTAVHESFDLFSPIEYHFLDSQIDLFYQNETRAGQIFIFGAGLTIFIACLGLFGLASFIIQKRTKEIGIRKVMGASTGNLYFLISSSFMKQVVIAWILAMPVAYIVMSNWLQLFQFRVSVPIEAFLFAGFIAVFIALITISYRSVRASLTNPSSTLRHE